VVVLISGGFLEASFVGSDSFSPVLVSFYLYTYSFRIYSTWTSFVDKWHFLLRRFQRVASWHTLPLYMASTDVNTDVHPESDGEKLSHSDILLKLCRLCGKYLPIKRKNSTYSATNYSVCEFQTEIKSLFKIDTSTDSDDVHPQFFCGSCRSYITRAQKQQSKDAGKPTEVRTPLLPNWVPHIDQLDGAGELCAVCEEEDRDRGGRRKKIRRTSTRAFTSSEPPITLPSLLQLAGPKLGMDLPLSPDRFLDPCTSLACIYCQQQADQAVQHPCCAHLSCAQCVHEHFGSTLELPCKHCSTPLTLRGLSKPSGFICGVLSERRIRCDRYETCGNVVPLGQLAKHMNSSACSPLHSSTPVFTQSSTVAQIMQAPPHSLKGKVIDDLASHIIACLSSEDGTLQQKCGRRYVTWQRLTTATVPSDHASAATLRKRDSDLDQIKQTMCGETGSAAQDAHHLRRQPKEAQQKLLQEAGLRPPSGHTPGIGLAIKADLQLPWLGLRKLKWYLKEFGVQIESEHEMRAQVKTVLPFELQCREEALFDKSGSIVMCPVASFPGLTDLILHFITLNEESDLLTWRDGAIPEDEVWVKVGGDHGDDSFKLCFQIVNVAHPNSLENTVPFLVFVAKDSASNLATLLKPYHQELLALASGKVTWKGKRVRLFLFGDYEFLTKSYGLSGSSGVRPCLFCLASKSEFQNASDTNCTCRSLQQLASDYADFAAAGSIISHAKRYNNVIRPSMLPIELTDICIPTLHLDLGIFPWLYEAMLRDAEKLDLMVARSDLELQSSESFAAAATKQQQLHALTQQHAEQTAQVNTAQTQLQWLIASLQAVDDNTDMYVQLVAATGMQHQVWLQQQTAVEDLQQQIANIEQELAELKVVNGPCFLSFEPVLKKHRIERQAYHSGAFVGNHIHRALKAEVLEQICSAPHSYLLKTFNPNNDPTCYTQQQERLLSAANELRERYHHLLTLYEQCRSIFAGCEKVTDDEIDILSTRIKTFMAAVRTDVINRHKKTITPKLHLHRLRVLVWQYLPSTLPTFNKLKAVPARRKQD